MEDEDGLDPYIEPCIVMERMSYNLSQLQNTPLLNSIESKRRILGDVAEGIEHLHTRGIVHRDIKLENVLVRVVAGNIVGRAKVSDFGVSRNAKETDLVTHTTREYTRPTGTSLYMPPEAFNSSPHDGSMPARDIWSLGVLMCEVLEPGFLASIVRDHPQGIHVITGSGQFAIEVAEKAQTLSCDRDLRDLAVSCLSLNPEMRPRIANVAEQLTDPNNMDRMDVSIHLPS